MDKEDKLLRDIKQRFPGVSRVNLGVKNRIEFSGTPGAVKVNKSKIILKKNI